MLTFSEALTFIKSGKAVRSNDWMRGRFVRIYTKVSGGVMSYEMRLYTPTDAVGTLFFPSQDEMFLQCWSLA